MKAKKYEVSTLSELLDVANVNNAENLIEGLSSVIRQYVLVIQDSRNALRKAKINEKKMKNSDILLLEKFTYIDDGKQENGIKIKF